MEERKKTTETEPCELQVGTGRPAARGIGARRQGERGVSAGGWAGASIGPHLADRGSCPPCAVRSMLTTHPPCAGAWREPRARECAAAARATGAHVGLAQAASWGQAVAASRADRQALSKRRDAMAMLVGRSRTYARGDIQSVRDCGIRCPSLQHIGQLVRVATFDGPARSFGKAANQPVDAVNQNCMRCQSLCVDIRYIHLDEEPRDTSKDARASVCAMVVCAKESAPLDLKDIASPTSQEVCLSSCVCRGSMWRGRRRWPYRWSRSQSAQASRGRD